MARLLRKLSLAALVLLLAFVLSFPGFPLKPAEPTIAAAASARSATAMPSATLAGAASASEMSLAALSPAQAKKVRVTFNANKGKIGTKPKATKMVTKGKKVGTLPKAPKRSGYAFKGWYTKKSGGVKITKNTRPKKNVTYYAQWKKAATPTKILAKTSFEGSYGPFSVHFDDTPASLSRIDIVEDPTAPDGSRVVRFSHEPGVRDGNFVGSIALEFPDNAQPTELWGQFYVKVSPNFTWNPIANKLIYMNMGDQHPVHGTTQVAHVLGAYSQWVDGPSVGWDIQQQTNPDLNQTIYAGVNDFS